MGIFAFGIDEMIEWLVQDICSALHRRTMTAKNYRYVGPEDILERSKVQPGGTLICNAEGLQKWLATAGTDQMPDGTRIATFTIGLDGGLFLAPRRSEHVACASGGPVLSAGEISFDDELTVVEVTNLSTGFCPERESWPQAAKALDSIGLPHPGQFTFNFVFRLCPKCGERNVVKEGWFYCALCDAELPETWNFSVA